MMPPMNTQLITERFTAEALELDVICGRDKHAFKHGGNQTFRCLIHTYRERYQTSHETKNWFP